MDIFTRELDAVIEMCEMDMYKNPKRKGGFIQEYLKEILKSIGIYNTIRKLLCPRPSRYKISVANRYWSLQTLKYSIDNGFNGTEEVLDYFNDQESKIVFENFFRKKVICALNNEVHINELFCSEEITKQENYIKLLSRNVKRLSDNRVKAFGFKFFQPCDIESSVHIEKCGLIYVSKETIDRLNNSDGLIIDCGAYNGDSALMLSREFPNLKIIAVEASKDNYNLLKKNVHLNMYDEQIQPLNLGVSDEEGIMRFEGASGLNYKYSEKGTYVVPVNTLDNLFSCNSVRLIKMDIEGGEYKALVGAEQIIKKDKPLLLISVYHQGSDITEVPKLIKRFNSEYRFYLRHTNPFSPSIDYMLICE